VSATYVYPATERVLYGEGALALLGEECERFGAERILLLTTPSLADTELRGGVEEGLADRLVGTLDGCSQHVPLEAVNALISDAHVLSPDLLVTLGGGSVIDAGKALAAGLAEGYDNASQIHEHRIVFEPPAAIEQKPFDAAPIAQVAVPTTLSAAEYDGIFGMTFEGTKDLYADPRLSPRTVLLDPAATEDTPAQLWASSGIRALDHAVEIFLSRSPTPVTDAACLYAVRLLAANLPRTLADPGDAESRARCQQAAWLSMLGVENVTLGLCHGIGHQIGARCNVPHGITSCVMLPTVLEAMVELMPGRCAELALAMGAGDAGLPEAQLAAALPTAVRGFVASLGLPTTLSEVGVAEEDFELIAHDSVRDFVVASAPLQVEEGDVVRLLRQALR
jgi:maleylacetate reductase